VVSNLLLSLLGVDVGEVLGERVGEGALQLMILKLLDDLKMITGGVGSVVGGGIGFLWETVLNVKGGCLYYSGILRSTHRSR
jgi:hypothetical protein